MFFYVFYLQFYVFNIYGLKDIEILTDEISLPPDRPFCDFYNGLCPEDNSGNYSHTFFWILFSFTAFIQRKTVHKRVVCVVCLCGSKWIGCTAKYQYSSRPTATECCGLRLLVNDVASVCSAWYGADCRRCQLTHLDPHHQLCRLRVQVCTLVIR